MPGFSKLSLCELATVDRRLYDICSDAIKVMDFTVLCGQRNKENQDKDFADGKSKLRYPDSKHNKNPSQAVDLAPYPVDWSDTSRFILLAGIIKGIAFTKGISIRWGGDWNGNNIIKDDNFRDLGHFELIL